MPSPEFTLPDITDLPTHEIGLILGSGLGSFVDTLDDLTSVPYTEIEGLPPSSVPGHAGKLHLGELAGTSVAICQGRIHAYEGFTAQQAAAPVRLLHQLGASTLILTNAAGIVNANFKPGHWMLLSDHLNLARLSPLTGSASFIDQTEVYSSRLRGLLKAEAAEVSGMTIHEGVYAWVNGPEYETPAEIRMLRSLGADAVGMSTVPEAILARALGMRVVALSCLTNYGAGISGKTLNHEEVTEVGTTAAAYLFLLLNSSIPAMAEI
ncbi:MAG: purine-nucleoside phosphorylase [Verrucomicrobiota bacterium]